MLNDDFGDPQVGDFEGSEDLILVRYHKWLHKVAYSFLDASDASHDDLVQEGRIAMWRALDKYNSSKGSLPSWLTKAAVMRMKDLAFGTGQPMGHEPARHHTEPRPVASTEEMVQGGLEDLLGASDALEGVETSYHQGEVWKALEGLSPAQKRYVVARFWAGVDPASRAPAQRELRKTFPEISKGYLWAGSRKQVGAKERLATALQHLESRT